jgi:hypothetical protein
MMREELSSTRIWLLWPRVALGLPTLICSMPTLKIPLIVTCASAVAGAARTLATATARSFLFMQVSPVD